MSGSIRAIFHGIRKDRGLLYPITPPPPPHTVNVVQSKNPFYPKHNPQRMSLMAAFRGGV